MPKKYREGLKERLEIGCMALGWWRWAAAGTVVFLIMWMIQCGMAAAGASADSYTFKAVKYGKCLLLGYCLYRTYFIWEAEKH
ncbi:hypothetical protein [Candidatus Electronema sp. JC]|uniref:hypothetical protein n=1 Tax=Candidatus Electronema sp. JC TaxID=3401570 RepID=UPI003B42F7C2